MRISTRRLDVLILIFHELRLGTMPKQFAFLRAVNVGGHNVTMERLRGLFEGLGLKGVESFLASGNVVFDGNPGKTRTLEQRIERHLLTSLGYEVRTFIRRDHEVGAIARYTPFEESLIRSAGAFCVGFLSDPLQPGARKSLMALASQIDIFHLHEREVFWLCKKRQSESKFSNAVFEKATGSHVTFRGMNTIGRLAAKYGCPPGAV